MKARGDALRAFFMSRCWQWCCLFCRMYGLAGEGYVFEGSCFMLDG